MRQLREGYWKNNEKVGKSRVISAEGDWFTGVGDVTSVWEGVFHQRSGKIYTGTMVDYS